MNLFPAIDLLDGRVVRLRQGDPETRGFEIWLSDVNS